MIVGRTRAEIKRQQTVIYFDSSIVLAHALHCLQVSVNGKFTCLMASARHTRGSLLWFSMGLSSWELDGEYELWMYFLLAYQPLAHVIDHGHARRLTVFFAEPEGNVAFAGARSTSVQ
jgi:hypothetical protein